MKKASFVVAALVLGAIGVTGSSVTSAVADKRPEPVVQDAFDPLGSPMHEIRRDGRTVHFSDTGEQDAKPVLFMGGTGTTARASGMTDFLRTTRENLKLRLISVERNGFGDTEYDGSLGFADYTRDVAAVLDELGVEKAPVIAISGGGPYAAHFAAERPERVSALHLAAASPPYGPTSSFCGLGEDEQRAQVAEQIRDPREWWAFGKDSPVADIPGFTDNAEEDGARSYYLRGQKGDPSAQVHEQRLYCRRPGPDLSGFAGPAYVYTGMQDTTVPPSAQKLWSEKLPGEPTVRRYEDSGHDVQYRHWDQILLDLAGYADRTAVCVGGKTRVPSAETAERLIEKGAGVGSCAWRG
ncbi:alpha/beta fold hydrolase [Streptomyces sp. NPDC054796]